MFQTFFGFELRYWLRGVMVYIFFSIVLLLIVGAASSSNVTVGVASDNTFANAPWLIQIMYGVTALLTCLMTTAFVNDAASRDFAHKTSQLIFTKPVNKLSFLMGRFWGAVLVSIIPMLGVSVGLAIAPFLPWNDASRFGEFNFAAHFWSIMIFLIPNTIFISAIIFAIAVWLRSTFASFIGIILLFTCWGITQSLAGNLDNEMFAQMLDPFGLSAFETQTKYWTVAEKNTQFLTLANPVMLVNRVTWLAIGLGILGMACWRFSFAERRARAPRVDTTGLSSSGAPVALPAVDFHHGAGARIRQLWSQFKTDFFGTVRSPVFLVIIFAAILDTFSSLQFVANEGFGLKALPVTYSMIDVIRGSLFVYLTIVITFYAGALVWRERDNDLNDVYDALPHSTWISYVAKLLAILVIILIVLFVEMLMGMMTQAIAGYTRFQISVYVTELFGITFVQFFAFTVVAFFVHIISPNKYIGYFLFIVLMIANVFAWGMFEVQSNMIRFANVSNYTYSDLFGLKPFAQSISWFSAYWALFCVFLSCIGILLWQRGHDRGFAKRIRIARDRFRGSLALATFAALGVWLAVGGWVFYNTQVLNEITSQKSQQQDQVDYETEFKENWEGRAQPRITKIRHDIEIYPEQRGLVFKGDQTIVNQSSEPIVEMLINLNDDFENEVEIESTTLFEEFREGALQVYKFDPPLAPGAEAQMKYTVRYFPVGFENSVSQIQLVQNGTFFNNGIAPSIGYQSNAEMADSDDRKKFGLQPRDQMPALEPDNLTVRANTYLSNSSDWVDVETVISTSDDQIAVAPGSLVKKWQENGRRYFHYKIDHPSLNFYSFVSADYQVALREWNGVEIEVYYYAEHEWNVDNMLRSIRKSLEYFSESFGPYKHKQARIIEFPRTSSFAQAFPGTMPYSEGIGFIAEIKEKDDIDMVFYVVAHEMAHQWWAHQVIGANMEGATVLSETLAQYSSLMVMEKEYGRDIMRKFLAYEMDSYLSSRGQETEKENPLLNVASNQGYIHYRKGSVVMYYLKEMIGEDKVNAALKSLITKFAYQPAPYPTSQDLVDALREQTPEDLQYLLDDLFKKITLFENRVTKTTYRKTSDNKYEVTIDVQCQKFQANAEGDQVAVAINDWIEIGAFGEPEEETEYGATLYRERVRIDKEMNTFTFTVDQLPALAGVDPFLLLIDRTPEDNVKKPELVGSVE